MYWPKLDALDEEQVEWAHGLILQIIEEKCPDLNAERGVVGSLVTELHAILQAGSMDAIEKLQHSLCARDVALDPDSALPDAVDALVSNFGVQRRISTKACGNITVVLDRCNGINFGLNTKFVANGQFFFVSDTITVRPPDAAPRSSNDQQAHDMGNGKFSVRVPVVANKIHENTMLRRFDKLEPTIRPGGFITAYATDDFTGGNVPQSNAELISKIRVGMATPSFSGTDNIKALVRASGVDVADIAVIGARNPEMTRDRRDGKVSSGGKLDIYIRTQKYPAAIGLNKVAELVSKTENSCTWEVELDINEAPGYYKVRDIRPTGSDPGQPGCVVMDDNRTFHTCGLDYVPDIKHPDEAKHSRYQASIVRFKEEEKTFGLVPGKDTKQFDVTVLVMPGIDTVQDYLNNSAVRQPGLDVLVKAAKPVWVTVEVARLSSPFGGWAEAVVNYINSLPIGTKPGKFALTRVMPDPDVVEDVDIHYSGDFDATCAAFMATENVTIKVTD